MNLCRDLAWIADQDIRRVQDNSGRHTQHLRRLVGRAFAVVRHVMPLDEHLSLELALDRPLECWERVYLTTEGFDGEVAQVLHRATPPRTQADQVEDVRAPGGDRVHRWAVAADQKGNSVWSVAKRVGLHGVVLPVKRDLVPCEQAREDLRRLREPLDPHRPRVITDAGPLVLTARVTGT
jgi:hypothetical protein